MFFSNCFRKFQEYLFYFIITYLQIFIYLSLYSKANITTKKPFKYKIHTYFFNMCTLKKITLYAHESVDYVWIMWLHVEVFIT